MMDRRNVVLMSPAVIAVAHAHGAAHPMADPNCPQCGGLGWTVDFFEYEAPHDPVVHRCDECLFGFADPPRYTILWDREVVPYAAKAGIRCRDEYPHAVISFTNP